MRGYCDICKREYANIYQHKQTARHKELAENSNKTEDNIEIVNDQEDTIPEEPEDNTPDKEPATAANTIQIIDGEPKKEKNTVEQIMEVAFSEQFAPITTSLLTALMERVTNQHNPQQKKGNVTYTQAGVEIEDF